MNAIVFRRVRNSSIANLYVAYMGNKPVGMIDKPVDDRHTKNAWRCYHGIGENAVFLGHAWTRNSAEITVRWRVVSELADVVVR